jgi:soluble lytic murein transglycosylase-like protein
MATAVRLLDHRFDGAGTLMKRVLLTGVALCASALPIMSAAAAGAPQPKTMMSKPRAQVGAPVMLVPADAAAGAKASTAPAAAAKTAVKPSVAAVPLPAPRPGSKPITAEAAPPARNVADTSAVAVKPHAPETTPATKAPPASATANARPVIQIQQPVQASLGSVPLPLPFPGARRAAEGPAGTALAFAGPAQAAVPVETARPASQAATAAAPRIVPPAGKEALAALVAQKATEHGVPFDLAHGVVMVESRYNAKATGPGGHVGLMQISYATAQSLGYSGSRAGLYDPETNLTFGMKYLGRAYKATSGDMCATLSKYQGGHRTVGVTRAGAAYCGKVRKINAAAKPQPVTADARSGRPARKAD